MFLKRCSSARMGTFCNLLMLSETFQTTVGLVIKNTNHITNASEVLDDSLLVTVFTMSNFMKRRKKTNSETKLYKHLFHSLITLTKTKLLYIRHQHFTLNLFFFFFI